VPKKDVGGRPPRAGVRASRRIELVVTDDEYELLTSAAGDEKLATWARAVLIRSARRAG
jgi:hypothetical protein